MVLPPEITFENGYAFHTFTLGIGYDGGPVEDRWETLSIRDVGEGSNREDRTQAAVERLLEKTARELIRCGKGVWPSKVKGRGNRKGESGRVRGRRERVPG